MTEYGIKADYVPLKSNHAETKPFEAKRSAEIVVDGEYLGVVGEFRNSVRNEFKLAPYLAGFEIDLKIMAEKANPRKEIVFEETVTEDITITTDKTYSEALKEVEKKYPEAKKIMPVSVYQAEGQKTRNLTFRVVLKKDK